MHLTRGGRDSEELRHPYLAALRQLLLDLVPRPTAAGSLGGGAAPPKRGYKAGCVCGWCGVTPMPQEQAA
jgi:hypothetical protein